MNMPPNAKKVFQGQIFDVYQWEQELFDGSKATFERLKRPNTLQVIPVIGDKIAIAYEEQPGKGPFLSLLGGRQEPNETPLEGAKRELLEESGLVSDDWEPWLSVQPVGKMDWTVHIFIAKNCKKTAEPHVDAGEKIEVREVGFDEFIETVLSDGFYGHEMVEQILRMKLEPKKLEDFKKRLFG